MKKTFFALSLCALLLMSSIAFAHSPIFDCFDNGDGTITCEGGFSDGSSASGVDMIAADPSGKVLFQGKMDQNSNYTFDKPEGEYTVTFDAGEGHQLKVDSKNIVE